MIQNKIDINGSKIMKKRFKIGIELPVQVNGFTKKS